jgi:hypothetical protein
VAPSGGMRLTTRRSTRSTGAEPETPQVVHHRERDDRRRHRADRAHRPLLGNRGVDHLRRARGPRRHRESPLTDSSLMARTQTDRRLRATKAARSSLC